MTLDEIKTAVDAGETVHWASPAYIVIRDQLKSGKVRYLIAYNRGRMDEHYWGLTHVDGVTMNEKPEQFYIAGKEVYRHTFDFAFTVQTHRKNPDDVTGGELRRALQMRAHVLPDAEMVEACGYLETDE